MTSPWIRRLHPAQRTAREVVHIAFDHRRLPGWPSRRPLAGYLRPCRSRNTLPPIAAMSPSTAPWRARCRPGRPCRVRPSNLLPGGVAAQDDHIMASRVSPSRQRVVPTQDERAALLQSSAGKPAFRGRPAPHRLAPGRRTARKIDINFQCAFHCIILRGLVSKRYETTHNTRVQ